VAGFITPFLGSVIAERSRPGITIWNRLEGRPRTEDFDRALRTEVRDPLWMLTRQWQIGEFQGDDAASPILVRARVDTTRLRSYQAGAGTPEPFDDATPLEATVERLPVLPTLDLRLLIGRHWLKLVGGLGATVRDEYVSTYPILPPDGEDESDVGVTAHAEAWSVYAAAAGRLMDGYALYEHIRDGGQAADDIASVAGQEVMVNLRGERLVAWFDRLIYDAGGSPAWQPPNLEYQFATAAPTGAELADGSAEQKVMVAREYYQGHLDWYNLDVDGTDHNLDPAATTDGVGKPLTVTMLPTSVTFNGMPNTRWWAFEDGRTNFGDIKPDTTDLAKLLLIDFGLVYANDWFLVPFTIPAGTLATVRGVAVTDVFGERTWVEASGRGDAEDWQRWALFLMSTLHGEEPVPADLSLAILPTAQKVLEGRPLDEVALIRDEMANLVWGIEKTVPLQSGSTKYGAEAARETRAWFDRAYERAHGEPPSEPPPANGAHIRYQLMGSVPEHWIPFVAMHLEGEDREIRLRRAAMPRVLPGETAMPPPLVRPRTWLLRTGLDELAEAPYDLNEEEVPRAGVRVTRCYQRTRWRDGRVWVWLGVRKQSGRGEGSSGLAFDRLIDV
jgi:hypothetical protein